MNLFSYYGLCACALAILALPACGIKPGSLEPPEGSDGNRFPREYPMPEGGY